MPKLGRPYLFPDPNDRSPNHPNEIIEKSQIIGLYNQEHLDDIMENVTSKVKAWISEKAKSHGWDKVDFVNSVCVLGRTDLVMKNVEQ